MTELKYALFVFVTVNRYISHCESADKRTENHLPMLSIRELKIYNVNLQRGRHIKQVLF